MELINIFLANQWVIGIVGGIVSGIIVYYITSYILDKASKREYEINVSMANNTVLDVLRPYIVNLGLPSKEQLDVVINSVSRQFRVERNEMYSLTAFYEELIVEFVTNLYIPDEVKKKNIEKLLENIDGLKKEERNCTKKEVYIVDERKKKIVGVILGIVTGVLSIFIVITYSSDREEKVGIEFLVMAVFFAISIIMIVLGLLYRKQNRVERLYRDIAVHSKSNHLVNREFIKIKNCGTSMDTINKEQFYFVDYFNEEEMNV